MIINLTQHAATAEQLAAGVVDLTGGQLQELKKLLTFNDLPSRQDVRQIASALGWLVDVVIGDTKPRPQHPVAMIGGAPFLMGPLEDALADRGVRAVYAFSRRESAEEVQPDGSIRKVAVFRHAGFVPGQQ